MRQLLSLKRPQLLQNRIRGSSLYSSLYFTQCLPHTRCNKSSSNGWITKRACSVLLPFALIAIRWRFCLIWEDFPLLKNQPSATFDFRAHREDRETTLDINWLSGACDWGRIPTSPQQRLHLWFWIRSCIHFPAPSCLTSHFREVSYLFELNFLIHK